MKLSQIKSKLAFINPFRDVIETRKHKAAHIERSTMGMRLWDTFFALHGKIPFIMPFGYAQPHFGLFDYATLGIVYNLNRLFAWLDEKSANSRAARWAFIPVAALSFPLEFLRLAATLILMAPAYPLVLLADFIVSAVAGEKIETALDEVILANTSLRTLLARKRMDVNDLEVDYKIIRDSEREAIEFIFHRQTPDFDKRPLSSVLSPDSAYEPEELFTWRVPLSDLSSLQQKHGFFKLNIGEVEAKVERLIESGRLEVDEQGAYHWPSAPQPQSH